MAKPKDLWHEKLSEARHDVAEESRAVDAGVPEEPVEIVVIVDESGSMQPLRADTIGGFNRFLHDQQTLEGAAPAVISVTCFSSGNVRTPLRKVAINEVEPWTEKDYAPDGGTPLLDAVGDALSAVNVLRKGIAVIITDGQENSSHKFTKAQIADLIGKLRAAGWDIQYFGANVDSFSEAGSIGIASASTASFAATPEGTHAVYTTMSSSTSSLRTTGHSTPPSAAPDWATTTSAPKISTPTGTSAPKP